ncbi:hypothetical protein A0J61_05062 [Choanephora cucurbitarum]|uniref:DUF8032 domain-containing protein n=1 Tax=Choanephora cucurbitarum TaxID=101091 RepID=A0A1C7NCP1_9FUNG|nr:hypothetical protein A0J61_05062 [Choanephora cucurbitarum]
MAPFPCREQAKYHLEATLSWPTLVAPENQSNFQPPQQHDLMHTLNSTELDMSSLVGVDQTLWPISGPDTNQFNDTSSQQAIASSLDPLFWNTSRGIHVPPTIKEDWPLSNTVFMQHQPVPYQHQFVLPPTPPVSSPNTHVNSLLPSSLSSSSSTSSASSTTTTTLSNCKRNSVTELGSMHREITPSTPISSSPNGNSLSPPPLVSVIPQSKLTSSSSTPTIKSRGPGRRKSADSHHTPTRTYRRRASSQPSVASVVSLSAHEPVARIIDGIEHITFLYSHDRLVKEYTVRTDVESVCLDHIPISFRVQNAIYPRANVSREEYDGNRWEYETSCNKLGWELCWLNQDQLCGRRGLIQRAVDSYRNRHAEMRSRRVTRQEKVANGTLRKRRAKKSHSALL